MHVPLELESGRYTSFCRFMNKLHPFIFLEPHDVSDDVSCLHRTDPTFMAKLPASPLITPIVVPCIIPYITPLEGV